MTRSQRRRVCPQPVTTTRSESPTESTAVGHPHRRRGIFAFLGALVVLGLTSGEAGALGAPAGTVISNQATASYNIGATPLVVNSLVNTVTVDELVDVTVTLLSAPVSVGPTDTNRVLAFDVSNSGNGIETFELDPLSVLGGDQFDPTFASIYLDDGDGSFDILLDTLYTKGANDPTLDGNDPLNDSIVVFLLNDIPAGPIDGDQGFSRLTATAVGTGAQAAGTVIPNGGDGGVIDAIVGTSGAQDSQDGIYVIATVAVSLVKTATVVPNATFGTAPVPGATIRYTIVVSVTGSGTADNLIITDTIPTNTIYEAFSMFLDDGVTNTNLTDISDADEGDFDLSFPGGIHVDLGSVAGGAPDHTITFDVMIDPN